MPGQKRPAKKKQDSGRINTVSSTVRIGAAKSGKNKLNMLLVGVILVFIGAIAFTVLYSVFRGEPGDCELYFVNAQNGLDFETITLKSAETEDRLDEAIAALRAGPVSPQLIGGVPDTVEIEKIEVSLDKTGLKVHFSEDYSQLGVLQDILCRAALVYTLTSIDEFVNVEFFIGETPIANVLGEPVGMQSRANMLLGQDMITSVDYLQVTLYFAGKGEAEGKLVKETRTIQVNSQPQPGDLPKLIVNALVDGPALGAEPQNDDPQALLPADTIVHTSSVDQGVNIISLNKDFLEKLAALGVDEELAVYSIVNSLTERDGISKVQIFLEGLRAENTVSGVEIYSPLEKRPELIFTE